MVVLMVAGAEGDRSLQYQLFFSCLMYDLYCTRMLLIFFLRGALTVK
jgi:hypothetical protein